MENRIGKFKISEQAMREAENGEYLDILTSLIFTGKFVMKCEFLMHSRHFEYIALDTRGKDFEDVTVGCEAPKYDCIITEGKDKDNDVVAITITWEQQ